MFKRKKIKLQKTVYDTFLFTLVVVLTAVLFLVFKINNVNNSDLYVYVYVESKLIDRLSLAVDAKKVYKQADYPIFLGDIELEIKNRKVQVEKETSPLNLCSIKGYTDQAGTPVICLPNSFYFVIMGADYATLER